MSDELTYPKRCAICHGPFEGWGHNAAPFPGRCCDDCNAQAVAPIRMAMDRALSDRRASREKAA
jgi:hypothetical protein